jgi:hypothetical protein
MSDMSMGPGASAARSERELTGAVDICMPNGRLNPAAVGWSRKPLHRANLRGWGRNKRFEYWCVTTPDFIVTANVSHHDYRANVASTFIDLHTHQVRGGRRNRWLPTNNPMADLAVRQPMESRAQDIHVRLTPNAQGTALYAAAPQLTVNLQVFEPEGRESMGVLVPWSDRLFQYTCKNNCLAVEGTVVVDGVEHVVRRGEAYAIHDRGRGRWPYDTLWNWAAASGTTDGHEIGLQFGAKWTAGTPSTENALRIDGRLHKISEELRWDYDTSNWMKPWTIQGARVNLRFTPVHHHHHLFDRWLISSRGDQCFGHFDGEIVSDAGDSFKVARVFGLAEEVHRKW